jgi:hypothetical protein
MKILRFSFVVFRFHARSFYPDLGDCESVALAAYEQDGEAARALLVKNHYQRIVHALGTPQDVVFVSTFLAGFAPLFAACTKPESVCCGIREDLLKAKDMLELSESQIILAPSLESALARVGQNYVKFDEMHTVTADVPPRRYSWMKHIGRSSSIFYS